MCSNVMAVHKTYVFKKLNKGRNETPYFFFAGIIPYLTAGALGFCICLFQIGDKLFPFSHSSIQQRVNSL